MTNNIPLLMQGLPRYRGLPVPFNVLIDDDGTPHFRINSQEKELLCLEHKLCNICGNPLKNEYWFIGGQKSAFHPKGVFNDGAVHKECGLYALRTCPYMINSNYKTINTDEKLQQLQIKIEGKTDPLKLVNPTQTLDRLAFFCFCKAKSYTINYNSNGIGVCTVKAHKPYEQVEFYLDGERIHKAKAKELLKANNEKSYLP